MTSEEAQKVMGYMVEHGILEQHPDSPQHARLTPMGQLLREVFAKMDLMEAFVEMGVMPKEAFMTDAELKAKLN